MTGHIFFSYRSVESDFGLKLVRSLRARGLPVWMDQLEGIRPGASSWVQTLQDALNNAAALIASVSPKYVQSEYCRKELQRATGLGLPVFPLLIEEVPAKDWPLEIQSTQYVDFRQWRDEATFNRKLDELVDALQERLGVALELAPQQEHAAVDVPLVRELEDRVDAALDSAASANYSGSAARQAERIRGRIEMLNRQLDAVYEQMDGTLNQDDIIKLESRVTMYMRDIEKYESQLEQLRN